jgi:hypothetical protein
MLLHLLVALAVPVLALLLEFLRGELHLGSLGLVALHLVDAEGLA